MKTVIASNSLGRDTVMDLEEYTRRAVTDHRCMCSTPEQFAIAEVLLKLQKDLAESCFNTLHDMQSYNPDYLDDGTYVGTPPNENGWTA